jgi:negative modulator of initiation of replication
MRSISIDEDIYDHLKKHGELGESPSSILRRLLGMTGLPSQGIEPTQQTDLEAFLGSDSMILANTAVKRFLLILAWLSAKDPESFQRVEKMGGRERKYFARSQEDLMQHGTSVNPKKIPGSEFWVITNTDTNKKCGMLAHVMGMLGYSGASIRRVTEALSS